MDSRTLWRLLDQIAAARDENALMAALETAAHFLGFTQFALGHHVDFGRQAERAIRITNYRREWIEEVVGRSYFRVDPVHEASVRCAGAFSWTQIPSLIKLTPVQLQIMSSAKSHGLLAGVTVPAHIPGEYRGTCSFGGSEQACMKRVLPFAQVLGTFAFEAARRMMKLRTGDGGDGGGVPRLTERQTDVLIELGRGKSDAEIALNLGIAKSTAHEHVEAVRAAYGGAQRTYLIGRALFDGQLSYVDIMNSY
ncbi:autoinducer binding domain-containing protein [Sphingobium naphthae]|nr:autoinducer binding domain-containing protein [Sphingobium naphthae]